MTAYYSAVIIFSVFAVIIIQVSVATSLTLTKNKKTLFYFLFTTIAVSAVCEWIGTVLQGTGETTRILHIIIKAIELSIAPSIGFLISWVIEIKHKKLVYAILGINGVLEIASGFTGFIYTVDKNSTYSHAQFYWIYIVAYLLSVVYFIYIVSKNIKKYQYSGIAYFTLVVIFMLVGIAVQLINSELKTVYVVLALASTMMYIFTLEMVMQTDKLTQLINRRGYENAISHLDKESIILFFDVDKFKDANDVYGHAYGDSCLRKTGEAIKTVYAKYGKCFRYGGDEFCVIMTKNIKNVRTVNEKFVEEMEKYRAADKNLPYISIGYAHFYPDDNVLTVIEEADKMMYANKNDNR